MPGGAPPCSAATCPSGRKTHKTACSAQTNTDMLRRTCGGRLVKFWERGGFFMQVRDYMSPSVVSITPEESAALAARLLARHNVGALPVCGPEGNLRGMVTDRDIVLRCVAAEEDPARTRVKDIMTRGCAAVAPDADPREAARLMAEKQVRRLPVVEDDRVVGVVSLGDLARSQRYDREASKALSEISDNVRRL